MRPDQLHNRFSQLVPERTRNFRVMIAGAGMVGSWTALALARMVSHVDIWDFDKVEAENVGVQAYGPADIGISKAMAVEQIGFGLPITGHDEPFPREIPPCDIVVLAVDSIPARRNIAIDCANGSVSYVIDTRVIGEIAYVEAAYGLSDIGTLIEEMPTEEETTHARCGAKGTAYAGMWVASQVCAVINSIGRGLPLPPKVVWHVGMNQSVAP